MRTTALFPARGAHWRMCRRRLRGSARTCSGWSTLSSDDVFERAGESTAYAQPATYCAGLPAGRSWPLSAWTCSWANRWAS